MRILYLLIATFMCSICHGSVTVSTEGLVCDSSRSLQDTLRHAHIPEYQFQVINTYPHDTHNFTEGLFFQNGLMYESSGLYGKSSLSIMQLDNAKIRNSYLLPKEYFAEGMTVLGNELYQLTWLEHTGFIYDKETLEIKRSFSIPNQGWGLTTDGTQLIMSDGSAALTMLDPSSMKTVRSVTVMAGNKKILSINELEYINGMIYANVWPTSIILVISPQDGKVAGWFSAAKLSPPLACMECVANGIAYSEKDNLIFLTGKNWPNLYAVRLIA